MKRFLTTLTTLAILGLSFTSVSAVEPSDPRGVASLEPAEVGPAVRIDREQKADLGTGSEPRRYLVRFHDPAVPSYEGGKPGLAATTTRGVEKLDADSAPAAAYRGHLEAAQTEFITRTERTVGHAVDVPFTYQFAVNGMAMVLTPDEARLVAADPAVASIALDVERELQTDVGPQWENADALWNAMAELGLPADIKGEGIVIGTIDTGISPGNSSFADVGDDGYNHTNPLGAGNYLGACDEANTEQFDPLFVCNDKLIGAYNFIGDSQGLDAAVDYDGHGTHTASTSGGNVVHDVVVETPSGFSTPPFDISGVAPHANVIAYRGCCTLSGLTESIDQAIADEVDVINYSIGSDSPSDLWDDFDAVGFLNARAAGIFVATSAGNAGPGDATVGSPADAPWLTAVGASSHNRHNGNAVTNLTSSGGPLPDVEGKSTTGPLSVSTPIMYAGDVGDPGCLDEDGHEAEFTGKIVICDGGTGRVAKSQRVADQGGVGFVLVNDEAKGDSLLADMYVLPGVFISFDNGETLKAWLATGSGHEAMIAGTTFTIDDARGDIVTGFSSRGPNRAIDTVAPSVTAPGLDVLAGYSHDSYTDDLHGFISGTSMASPHAAGAGALLTQARPGWTPAQLQSALMTTARNTVLNHDGQPATPYQQGSGHIDVGAAAMAGLLFDETLDDYLAANPEEGGDPKTLNLASFADSQCLGICSWQRVATVPDDAEVPADVTWVASTSADLGLTLEVTLGPVATVSPGDSLTIDVSAIVTGAPAGETLFGWVTLTPSDVSVPTITMPVAVVPTTGILPGTVTVETRRDAGSYPVNGIESIALVDFTGSMAGLVEGTIQSAELDEDPTNTLPYDDLGTVDVYTVEVPDGASRLVAEIVTAEMPDLDLYVGTGSTPSLATETCVSATASAIESCNVIDPAAGTWWVLIQNWEGTDAQPDAYTLSTAAVPGTSSGNGGVAGPDGVVLTGDPYDIRVTWDEPAMEAGDRWYGTAVLGSSPATPGDIGSFSVDIHRVDDDVTKVASVDSAVAGDTISYDITVQPNVTPEDLTYTITDTVPDGLTIDESSVTGGGVVVGQTITWEVDVPTPVGVVGDYVVSTPATSPQCAANTGFLDLGAPPLNIPFAPLDGDTVAASAFSAIGPFEQYGQDFTSLTVAEDGIVTVAGGYGGEPWVAQAIPDTDQPNGVFAPLWSDLELSLANNRGMRLAQGTGVAVIQWDNPFEFTGDATVGPSVGKFQAWIYTSVAETRPEMTFEYAAIGALPSVATIGTENILGTLATTALNAGDPSTEIEAGGSICLDYDGPTFDPITVEYDVTVADNAFTGTYTNAAVHTTDDPFAEPATASDSVEVDGVPNPTPFQDVNGNPFIGDIEWAYQEGITLGCSTDPPLFCPKTPVTREQMASFLVRALDLPPPTGDYFFDDESSPHEADINSLFEANITTGCAKFSYCPTLIVPREQMASFLVRGFHIAGPAVSDHFTDDESSVHEGDINILFEAGVTTGCGGTFYCPSNPVLREQMVAFLHRASLL